MARFYTNGMETTPVTTEPSLEFEGNVNLGTSTTITRDTSVKRSGASSRAHTRGGTSALVYTGYPWGLLGSNGYYFRMYFQVSNLPTGSTRIAFLAIGGSGSAFVGARLTSGGKIQLWNETGTPAQIGSDSAATVAAGTWYRLELYGKTGVGAVDETELRLNGVSVASATGQSISDTQIQGAFFGWLTSPGGAYTIYVDDVIVNDDTGASHNSWPGDSSIVYLDPIADSSVTGSWTAGAGGGSNLFEAVNNDPIAGVAAASATDTSQIKNTDTGDTTGNYNATMESYATAGLTAQNTVTNIQGFAAFGTNSTTAVSAGLEIVSNPAQGSMDTATRGGSAISSYGTNWVMIWGTVQASPTVTLATQPVFRVGRRGAQANEIHVCHMGMAVEYTTSLAQAFRPSADVTTTGWTATPLWSKIEESVADGTIITATAS